MVRTFSHFFLALNLFLESLIYLFKQIITFKFRLKETLIQIYYLGWMTFPIMFFCLLAIGWVVILEFSYHMKLVLRQDSLVPAFSSVMSLREIIPVTSALLFTSRVGASLTAQIATMKTTEQLDALRVMKINWVDFFLVPRWVACLVSSVCLCLVCWGAFYIGATLACFYQGLDSATLLMLVLKFDLIKALLKILCFSTLMVMVCAVFGQQSGKGAQAIGESTAGAVVLSTVLIILSDFALSYLLYPLY